MYLFFKTIFIRIWQQVHALILSQLRVVVLVKIDKD